MPRRLLVAACAMMLAAAALMVHATDARAHRYHRHYDACFVTGHGAWLYSRPPYWCDRCCCGWPAKWRIYPGRAFRVDDEYGPYLWVWNREMSGWINHRDLRVVRQAYCYAAGLY